MACRLSSSIEISWLLMLVNPGRRLWRFWPTLLHGKTCAVRCMRRKRRPKPPSWIECHSTSSGCSTQCSWVGEVLHPKHSKKAKLGSNLAILCVSKSVVSYLESLPGLYNSWKANMAINRQYHLRKLILQLIYSKFVLWNGRGSMTSWRIPPGQYKGPSFGHREHWEQCWAQWQAPPQKDKAQGANSKRTFDSIYAHIPNVVNEGLREKHCSLFKSMGHAHHSQHQGVQSLQQGWNP